VRSALATIPGVYQVGVDTDTQSIYIAYDATLGAPEVATVPMIAALNRVGFDPWLKGPGWPPDTAVDVLPR
jgi:hypothetical protein